MRNASPAAECAANAKADGRSGQPKAKVKVRPGRAEAKASAKARPGNKPGAGRPAASKDSPYTMSHSFKAEEPFADQAAFMEHEKAWAAQRVPNRCLNIRHQYVPLAGHYQVFLWCNSCEKCQAKKGWRGYSKYNLQSKEVRRTYTPISEHGDFSAQKKWTPLTATAENALKEYVKTHAHFTTQDLVAVVEEHQAERPSDSFLKTWGKNHRVHKGTPKDRLSKCKWVESDWRQLQRNYGSVEALLQDPPTEWPSLLKFGQRSFNPKETCVTFCNPALLHETLSKLSNKEYVKLCGDGTFRLAVDEWVLMTVGVLTKHYSQNGGVYAFRTTFSPLMFALANKESEATHRILFESLVSCAREVANLDLREIVAQYHADLHMGEEKARQQVWPKSERVADFAHLIGACQRPRARGAHQRHDPKAAVWRAGLFATMKRKLSHTGQRLLPLIERTIFLLRSVPTALLFHSVAHVLQQTLLAQVPPEKAAVQALRQHYLTSCSPREAKERFEVSSWPGQDNCNRLILADWWHGVQRLQPGSASGTQAQEAWHRHKLKKRLQHLHQPLDALFSSLQTFTQSRLKDLRAIGGPLPDVPVEPFPDRHVLLDSNVLTCGGRTSAQQYHRTGAYDIWRDANDSTYYAMRRTHATFDQDKKAWSTVRTPDADVQKVRPGTAEALARLVLSKDGACLEQALRNLELGPTPLRDINALLKCLSTHVLVVHGPAAAKYWRRQGGENPHTQILCLFCEVFGMHGTCEHVHTALLHCKLISLQQAEMPARGKRGHAPLCQLDPIPIVLPGAARLSQKSAEQSCSTPTKRDQRLLQFLAAHDLASWAEVLQAERLSVELLAAIPLTELKAMLPSIPTGVLHAVSESSKTWSPQKAARAYCVRCAVQVGVSQETQNV